MPHPIAVTDDYRSGGTTTGSPSAEPLTSTGCCQTAPPLDSMSARNRAASNESKGPAMWRPSASTMSKRSFSVLRMTRSPGLGWLSTQGAYIKLPTWRLRHLCNIHATASLKDAVEHAHHGHPIPASVAGSSPRSDIRTRTRRLQWRCSPGAGASLHSSPLRGGLLTDRPLSETRRPYRALEWIHAAILSETFGRIPRGFVRKRCTGARSKVARPQRKSRCLD